MRTRTPQRHAPDDRLEQLLRSAGAPSGDGEGEVAHEGEGGRVGPGGLLEERARRGRHRGAEVPLLSVPGSLRSAQLRVGARAVRGLLVLVAVATLVLGGRWLWTERLAQASAADRVATGGTAGEGPVAGAAGGPVGGQPLEGRAGSEEDRAGSQEAAARGEATPGGEEEVGAGAGTGAAPAGLVVHVAGQVAQPGVVTLPAGSRVVDAVRAAGGVTAEADQSTLNLARPLVDGERVWVGRPGETPPVAPGPLPGATGGSASGGAGGAAERSTPLDLNAATQADLEELPGVGPVTAGHILGWREEHGRFSSVEELLEVSGIGERTLAQLEPLVTVGG